LVPINSNEGEAMGNRSILSASGAVIMLMALAVPDHQAVSKPVVTTPVTPVIGVHSNPDFKRVDLEMLHFAAAFLQVRRIHTSYEANLKATGNQKAKDALQTEEKAALASAVERAGIRNMQRYDELLQRVNNDATLARWLDTTIKRLQLPGYGKPVAPPIHEAATRRVADNSVASPPLEIAGLPLTQKMIDVEIPLALTRRVTSDWRDRDRLVCRRTNTTRSRIRRMWCGLNGQLFQAQEETRHAVLRIQDGHGNGTLLPGPDVEYLAAKWRTFYNALPEG